MDVEGNIRKLNAVLVKRKWVVYKVTVRWIKSTFVQRASTDDIRAWNEIFILVCISVQRWSLTSVCYCTTSGFKFLIYCFLTNI